MEQYYRKLGFDSFELPSDLAAAFDHYYGLDDTLKERFWRAAYWVNHAVSIFVSSASASHVALVQAIEALMPAESNEVCPACGKPKGDGPTAAFQKFVDKYASGVPPKDHRDFYSVRSSLTHGRGLHRWDRDGFSFSPIAMSEPWAALLVVGVARALRAVR